jgi:hypothetical protein
MSQIRSQVLSALDAADGERSCGKWGQVSRRLELGCTKGGTRWGLEGVLARRRRTSGADGGNKWVLVDTEEEWFELERERERERELERAKANGMMVGQDGTSTQPVQDKIKHWQMNLPGADYNPLPPSSIPLPVPSSLATPIPLSISAPAPAPPAPAAPSPKAKPLSTSQPQPQSASGPTNAESSTVRKAERVRIWQADLDLAAASLVDAGPPLVSAADVAEAVVVPPPTSIPVPIPTTITNTKPTAPAPAPTLANKTKSKGKGREGSKDPSPLGFPVVKRANASSMKPGHAPSHSLSQELAHEPPPKLPKPAKTPRLLEDDLVPSSLPAEPVVGIAAAVGVGAGKGEDVEMNDDAAPCKGAVVTIEDVSEMVSNAITFTLFNPTQ